mmetsp:Transcript_53107/g.119414  ORF Transcript_53107/g.119414 Transcript_53107/m.119414 type:complete len:380 (+) Transcript_53107:1-1140(+)
MLSSTAIGAGRLVGAHPKASSLDTRRIAVQSHTTGGCSDRPHLRGALALCTLLGLRVSQRRRRPGILMAEAAKAEVDPKVIDGTGISKKIRQQIKEQVDVLKVQHGVTPGLGVILVGERPDSATYVRMKKKASDEAGFHSVDITLPADVTEAELLAKVDELNEDDAVHGILVQLPLPDHIDEHKVLKRIRVDKDVDGFSAENIGNLCLKGGEPPLAVPCTPAGCIELLQECGIDVAGKEAVVLGRSNIVGMPVATILQSMNATVTVCHSGTKDVAFHTRRADIIVAAIGKMEYLKADMVKPGVVIVDVGINEKPDETKKSGKRLVGDVDYEAVKELASRITPVPGGVGPMTITMLLKNTLNLARHAIGLDRLRLRRQVS